MSILKIHTDESEYLHKPAAEVSFPLDKETKQLIADMKETLLARSSAVGLAAPQVGSSLQILVYLYASMKEPMVMINPSIVKAADYGAPQFEMCLSYPEEVYDISRAKRIAVRFYNEDGTHVVLKYRNEEARIIQHESDHLLGITIKDRGRKVPEEELKELVNKFLNEEGLLDEEDNEEDGTQQ